MKPFMIVALLLAVPLHDAVAVESGAAPAAGVASQKIDSGLGELPHYRLWADPSGKSPTREPVVVKADDPSKAKSAKRTDATAAAAASTHLAGLK